LEWGETTFGLISGFPELHVLESTDPAQVKAFENKVDLKKTLFVVSSKSGSTFIGFRACTHGIRGGNRFSVFLARHSS
jgi:hypothetical protein